MKSMAMGEMRSSRGWKQIVASAALAAMLVTGMQSHASAAGPAAKDEDLKKMEAALPDKAPAEPKSKRKVLVYGNANGFVHSSIPLGQATIAKLGEKTGAFAATVDNDPANFDADKLKEFDTVVLVSTTGHFLIRNSDKDKDQAAEKQRMQNLLDFVEKDGKGLVGIHASSDAYYDSREYGELIGGYFNGHPWNEKVGVKVDDAKSPLTSMFEKDGIDVADEIYQFTPRGKDQNGRESQVYSRDRLHVLLSLDYTTAGRTAQKGKSPDNDFGIAWIHAAGKGGVFYCSLGHREEIYWNPTILKFYLAGIEYADGDLAADATPSKTKEAAAQ